MDPNSYVGQLRAVLGPRLLLLPSVRAIVEDERGWVLLQGRADFGNWGPPGGMPEPGESAAQAIVREVREETGLEVDASTIEAVCFASDPATESIVYPNGHQVHSFTLVMRMRASGELHAADSETTDVAYFDPQDLPAMQPDQRRTVEMYLQYKKTGRFQLY